MQKFSSKKISHKAAKEYRDGVVDSVMYEHTSGSVYKVPSLDDVKHGVEDKPEYVTDDTNELLIG